MKKFVAGLIVGAFLIFSFQVAAESISKVGKRIDSEIKVELNGAPVGQAIVTEGKSYAPVRDIANAIGAKIKVSKEVIQLDIPLSDDFLTEKIRSLEAEENYIQVRIENLSNSIIRGNQILAEEEARLSEARESSKAAIQERINNLKSGRKKSEDEITQLQTRLAEIEQELAALETQ